MPTLDPFQGAAESRSETQRALLASIAQAGQAGKEQFLTAKQEVERARAAALSRAQQRAALTGQDLGGADTAAAGETADRFNMYLGSEEAAQQAHLGSIGASGQSYLAKVGQIAPFMQQKAIDQAAERENQYKMEVAQNQAQIDAQKAAAEAEHRRQIELLNLRNQFDVASGGRAAAAPKPPSLKSIVGEVTKAQQAAVPKAPVNFGPGKRPNETMDQYLARLETAAQGRRDAERIVATPTIDLAYDVATRAGVPNAGELYADYEPPAAPVAPPAPPPLFDANWIMANVTMPGTNKKATASRAADVLRAPELALAQEFLGDLAAAKKTRGAIDDPVLFGSEYRGMSPKAVFNTWIMEQDGILTMKEALKQYYAPYLDSLGRA